MMGFAVFLYIFFQQEGCACGGTAACDKTSVYATCRAGAVGEGGVNMRRLGVGERYFFSTRRVLLRGDGRL